MQICLHISRKPVTFSEGQNLAISFSVLQMNGKRFSSVNISVSMNIINGDNIRKSPKTVLLELLKGYEHYCVGVTSNYTNFPPSLKKFGHIVHCYMRNMRTDLRTRQLKNTI
jgi:hypothetical protein